MLHNLQNSFESYTHSFNTDVLTHPKINFDLICITFLDILIHSKDNRFVKNFLISQALP